MILGSHNHYVLPLPSCQSRYPHNLSQLLLRQLRPLFTVKYSRSINRIIHHALYHPPDRTLNHPVLFCFSDKSVTENKWQQLLISYNYYNDQTAYEIGHGISPTSDFILQ